MVEVNLAEVEVEIGGQTVKLTATNVDSMAE
jgi:hypothetical protein